MSDKNVPDTNNDLPGGNDEFTRYREKVKAEASQKTWNGFLDLVSREMQVRSEEFLPAQSFWFHRPTRNFPPSSIRYPSDYSGGDRINISCTQTELKTSEQKKLVQSWCELLPTLENVEYIWFSSRTPQELFDAVCKVKDLKGLYIKWSGIKTIANIGEAKNLKYLHIGSTPSLESVEPLGQLPALEWLELENIPACADLRFLANHRGLKGLSISGDRNSSKYLKVQSLVPLTDLQQLQWLSLSALVVEDEDLLPLARLRALKYLQLANKYKMEEVAKLAGARPDLECELFEPISDIYNFLACKKCKERRMVLPTGAGKPWMCLDCDSAKIEKHRAQFNTIANEYLKWSAKK